jgi:hypothetical protein
MSQVSTRPALPAPAPREEDADERRRLIDGLALLVVREYWRQEAARRPSESSPSAKETPPNDNPFQSAE